MSILSIQPPAVRGGRYIFFPDSDVIVPLESFALLLRHCREGHINGLSLEENFFWGSKYHIPNQIVQRQPSLEQIDDMIARNWQSFLFEELDKIEFCGGGVGLLMNRDIWFESRGCDESLIYWGWYDVDWHRRLKHRYRWDRLEEHNIKLFHLEHYSARQEKGSQELENKQPPNRHIEPVRYAPNRSDWGLRNEVLSLVDGFGEVAAPLNDAKTPVLHRTVRQIVEESTFYRKQAATRGSGNVRGGPPHPLLMNFINRTRPESIAQISCGTLSEHVDFFATLPFVKKVYCFDLWKSECLVASKRHLLRPEIQNSLYTEFPANVLGSGGSGKVYPVKLPASEVPQFCVRHNLRFDLIYYKDERELEGIRTDIRRWLPLLSPGTVIYGNGGPMHFSLYRMTEEFDQSLIAGGFRHFELGGYWCIIPEKIFEEMKPMLQQYALDYVKVMEEFGSRK